MKRVRLSFARTPSDRVATSWDLPRQHFADQSTCPYGTPTRDSGWGMRRCVANLAAAPIGCLAGSVPNRCPTQPNQAAPSEQPLTTNSQVLAVLARPCCKAPSLATRRPGDARRATGCGGRQVQYCHAANPCSSPLVSLLADALTSARARGGPRRRRSQARRYPERRRGELQPPHGGGRGRNGPDPAGPSRTPRPPRSATRSSWRWHRWTVQPAVT
jgi:hypothetical protein